MQKHILALLLKPSRDLYSEDDKALFQQVRKLQDSEINKYLNRNSPFSGIWENIIHTDGEDLPEETKSLITEYLQPKLKKLFEEQSHNNFIFQLPPSKVFKTANLVDIELSDQFIAAKMNVTAAWYFCMKKHCISGKKLRMCCRLKNLLSRVISN